MKVRIDSLDVFNGGDQEVYGQLQRLFQRAAQGQHELVIAEPERVRESDFMAVACARMNRVEWEEMVLRITAAPAFAPERPCRCAVVGTSQSVRGGEVAFALAPEEVGNWAEQPLRVLLENARDAALLR